MTAREWDPSCTECNRTHMQVLWRRGDLANLRRKASSDRAPDHGFADRLAEGKSAVVDAEVAFEEHLALVHPDGIEVAPRKIADVRRKKAPPKGKVKCLSCGKYVSPLGTRLRAHRAPLGEPCPGANDLPRVKLTEPPPVHIQDTGNHYDAPKGECRECGKRLPGERSLCGRCSVIQGRAS